jgi:hypothetical protein
MSRSFLNSGTLIVKICASACLVIQHRRENPAKIPVWQKIQFGKKSATVYHSLYSSTGQLQLALWMFLFIRLGLNKEKSLNTLPLHACPSHISPSLILPSRNPPSRTLVMGSLMRKKKRMTVDNIFLGFQKSGTKVEGFYILYRSGEYAVLFVPLFCRPREKCGILWKTTWLHNVDNIRQKDITNLVYGV